MRKGYRIRIFIDEGEMWKAMPKEEWDALLKRLSADDAEARKGEPQPGSIVNCPLCGASNLRGVECLHEEMLRQSQVK